MKLNQELIDEFGGVCGNFPCSNPAVTVHEIVPRSQAPADWTEDSNRIPLCRPCHERIHREGTRLWMGTLKYARKIALDTLTP